MYDVFVAIPLGYDMTRRKLIEILGQYEKEKTAYEGLCEAFHTLLSNLIKDNHLSVLAVTSRVKELSSLRKKLDSVKGRQKYRKLTDVTDIAGLRVVTYFEDDVKRIADIVEREFNVDTDNSGDKAVVLRHDQFGYLSVHYVVKVGNGREKLSEYRKYKDFKVEVQIRSILQHAWAEIEHDLGYKNEDDVPLPIRRKFSRLAGLLELCDEEFVSIRQRLTDYRESLRGRIAAKEVDVEIDADSLEVFIDTDPIVRRIDNKIADLDGHGIEAASNSYTDRRVTQLKILGVTSIEQLRKLIGQHEDEIVSFADIWIKRISDADENNEGPMIFGVSIFYLQYILLLRSKDSDLMNFYMNEYFSSEQDLAGELIDVYAQVPERYKR
ncbi:GTP pyrophosphokinase [Burkholderia cepacia]|uniref:GTP pyrophosphokinase n=1 Tax=Burkholderia cepacia TaxID=292 RepID=UPI002AB69346|nr:hypothetical protein [Burkholderia cepacia]